MLRVALIGASHWHSKFYYEPLIELESASLCAVSDPDPSVARHLGERLQCPWFTDHRDLLEDARPDFVFALGQHAEMAAIGQDLIDAGVAFALEKPCGISYSQVTRLRASAVAVGAFAAVPLAFRCSRLLHSMQRMVDKGGFQNLSFRFIAGPPQRYRDSGCSWMLDPERSGGGCTINLAVHFFDLYALLTGEVPSVVGADMSNGSFGLPVEDYSAVLLGGGGAHGLVETGYALPVPTAEFDLRFSLRSDRYYFTATGADPLGPDRLVAYHVDGGVQVLSVPVSQVPHYGDFVTDTLDRFQQGRPPIAGLDEMCAAMGVVDSAYTHAGWGKMREKGTGR